MSALPVSVAAPAAPPVTEQPAPAPLHPVPPAGSRWDPVAFCAGSTASRAPEEPATTRPQLVWSNGRPRELPDPQTWAGTVARACVEALRGTRPSAQLHRWLDPEVFVALSRRADLAARVRTHPERGHAVRVRRVRPCRIAPGVWEAAVVLVDGRRVRAAAVRMEEHRGHWRTTAVQIA